MSLPALPYKGRQRQDYPRRMITLEAALDALINVGVDMINACDELRVNQDVPNPEGFVGWGTTIGAIFTDASPVALTPGQLVLKRHPESIEDWECRGWLEDNSERSVSSPCGLNPYCWSSLVFSFAVAFKDAAEEIEKECYPKDNKKPRNFGPVRSRKLGQNFRRNPGRPNVQPFPPPPPPGPRGRPKKPQWKWVQGKRFFFPSTTEAKRGTRIRGRPQGSKDDPKSKRQQLQKLKRQQQAIANKKKTGGGGIIFGPNGLPLSP